MPIETPTLNAPLDYSVENNGSQAVFDRNLQATVEGVDRLGKGLASAKLEGIKDDFGELLKSDELQFRLELNDQLAASNVNDVDLLSLPGVTEENIKAVPEEAKTFMRLDARDKTGVQQGFLDQNDYQIRAEARMRQYLVRYPHLQDELLAVAANAGGFGLVPADLQATFEEIKAVKASQAGEDSEIKRLKLVSKEAGVDQTLYTLNPGEYWTQTIRFAKAGQSLAELDMDLKRREKTGTLNSFNLKSELNKAVPGLSALAWSRDIQPAVMSSQGISNINQFDPAKYNPVALDSIRQELQNKKARFTADMVAKYGGSGDVSASDIALSIKPTLDMYDAALERLGSKTFATDMTNHVNTLMNGKIMSMPNGPALQVYANLARNLERTFSSDLLKREVGPMMEAGIASLFVGGNAVGTVPNFGPDGKVLPFANNNALVTSDKDPSVGNKDFQTAAVALIQQTKAALSGFGSNTDPALRAVYRDASIQALRMFTDYYNDDSLKQQKGVVPTVISDEIISFGATDSFKIAFQESEPELQRALVSTFKRTTASEYDQVMRGEVNQDIGSLLSTVNQVQLDRTFGVGGGFGGPGIPTFLPGTNPIQDDIAKTKPVILTIDPKSGQAYFVPDNAALSAIEASSISLEEKSRAKNNITSAADQLTAKYGGRLTNLVRMDAHATPGNENNPQPYAASFRALSNALSANGTVNIQIDDLVTGEK